MRYRELTTRKIENIEGKLKALKFIVNRAQPIEEYLKTIAELEETVAEV